VETVQQYNFIKTASELLDEAEAPKTVLEASVENAKKVQSKLGDVAAGRLVVEPPLSHDQIVGLETRAGTIENIGQKALDTLAETTRQRSDAETRASEAAPAFSGTGSDGKS
jgi:hypothetical protein